MTKKDFELIAEAVRTSRMTVHAPQHDRTAKALADALATTNPSSASGALNGEAVFDRARFVAACGVAS